MLVMNSRSIVRRLVLVFAQILDPTTAAARLARLADVAAVKDQPVVRIEQILLGHELDQPAFHLQNILAGGDVGAVADPEDMRVHRHGELVESGVEHDVGGLAADAGQGFQVLAIVRHLAAMPFDEQTAGFDDVFRLGRVQADGLDVSAQAFVAQGIDGLRRVGDWKEPGGGLDRKSVV